MIPDEVPPTIVCPASFIIYEDSSNVTDDNLTTVEFEIFDNIGFDAIDFVIERIESTAYVTVSVSDAAGLSAECSYSVFMAGESSQLYGCAQCMLYL
jgi:hypothetical protein